MNVSDAKRLKAPEDENAKLKKLLADQMLEAAGEGASIKKWSGTKSRLASRCKGPCRKLQRPHVR